MRAGFPAICRFFVKRIADRRADSIGVVAVDDDPRFRAATCRVVEETDGFTLLGEAACGEDGVALAARLQPDLLIVDLVMPGMSGLETCARLARLRPQPRVILTSASVEPDVVELAGLHGAARFIPKDELDPASLRLLWEQRDGVRAAPSGAYPY